MDKKFKTMEDDVERLHKLSSVDLHSGDILIISADSGKLPPAKAEQYFKNIKDNYVEILDRLNMNDVEVCVVNKNVDFSVLHMIRED